MWEERGGERDAVFEDQFLLPCHHLTRQKGDGTNIVMVVYWISIVSCVFATVFCHHHYRDRIPDPGLRYAYTIVCTTNGETSCFGAGYVDGEFFIGYRNGETHRVVKWLPAADVERELSDFKNRCTELDTDLRQLKNKSISAGVKTIQLDIGCKSTFGRRYALDGSDKTPMFSLNGTSNHACRSKLQIYRALVSAAAKFPKLEVERRVVRHPREIRLRCIARDFYPAHLELQWWRESDGRFSLMKDSEVRDSLPSGDGLYQKHVDIYVDSGDEDMYSCRASGIATRRSLEIVKWNGQQKRNADSVLFIALFLPVCIVFGIMAATVVLRRRARSLGRARNSLKSRMRRRTSTQRTPYRVTRHTEPPRDVPVTIYIHDETFVNVNVTAEESDSLETSLTTSTSLSVSDKEQEMNARSERTSTIRVF